MISNCEPIAVDSVNENTSTTACKKKVAKPKKQGVKKGCGRPFRKLELKTLEMRMTKLQKRIEKTSKILSNAKSYLAKYDREHNIRKEKSEGGTNDDVSSTLSE